MSSNGSSMMAVTNSAKANNGAAKANNGAKANNAAPSFLSSITGMLGYNAKANLNEQETRTLPESQKGGRRNRRKTVKKSKKNKSRKSRN